MSENDENTETSWKQNAKMVGPHWLTEDNVGMNSEGMGKAQKERQCPGMMNVCSWEVSYTRSDGHMALIPTLRTTRHQIISGQQGTVELLVLVRQV